MTELTIVNDLKDIPQFASEAEEVAFWNTHTLAAGKMTREHAASLNDLLPAPRPRANQSGKSTPTSIRLGIELERRLRSLADLKGTTYQTLLKEFVLERVYEEEKRLKII